MHKDAVEQKIKLDSLEGFNLYASEIVVIGIMILIVSLLILVYDFLLPEGYDENKAAGLLVFVLMIPFLLAGKYLGMYLVEKYFNPWLLRKNP